MLDRTQAPSIQEIPTPKIPAFDELMIQGKYPLSIINQGDQPVIIFEMILPVGRWNESIPGLAFFTSKMLLEGTDKFSSEDIAKIFEDLGAHIEVSPTLDAVHIKLYSLKKHFLKLLEKLFEIIDRATFPEKDFDTLKQIRAQQIIQQHAKNSAFASLKFRELLLGTEHPYGKIMLPEEMLKIKLEDVRAFHRPLLSDPQFFLAGMVDDDIIDQFGQMTKEIHFNNATELIFEESKRIKQLEVDRNSNQASIRTGHITISKDHLEIHKLKITNVLFGGFFGSRLMKNIREEKGLTYGIHSSMTHLKKESYWQIGTEVKKEKLKEAKAEILLEMEKLQTQPPSQDELSTVTNYLKGKYLSTFETPINSLNAIKSLHQDGLTTGYYSKFFETLERIRPEDIQEMAQKHFKLNEMAEAIVV